MHSGLPKGGGDKTQTFYWPGPKWKKGLTEGKCKGSNNGAQLWAASEDIPPSVGQLKTPKPTATTKIIKSARELKKE